MGKKDAATKEYMKDPVRFADAFNQYLYQGRTVLKPERLWELDAEEIVLPYGDDGTSAVVQKYRDVLKLAMTDGNMVYCILGIENQGEIHYAIPVKNGLYDFVQLARQVTETAKAHRAAGKTGGKEQTESERIGDSYRPGSGEFLSGFYRTDRLLPVVTLVIYFGTDEWDGPLSLREMYALADDSVIQYAPDYKVNLIAPYQMSEKEISRFKTDLREVMLFLKYAKDKKKLEEAVQKDEVFRRLDRQAAEVINVTANADLKYPEGEEDVDMCVAIQEMVKDGEIRGEKKGEIRGAVKAYKAIDYSLKDTVVQIAETFHFSLRDAEKEVKKYWEQK